MAIVSLTTIKEWFKKFDRPTEQQFSDTWDSLWHKDEKIPEASIENLSVTLLAKQDKPAVLHYADPMNSLEDLAALSQPTLTQGQRRYVREEKADYFYDGTATYGDVIPANQLSNTGFWINGGASDYFAPKSGTYAELKTLRDEGKLIPGQKYLLSDYQCKYLIDESDTLPVLMEDTITETAYSYYIKFSSAIVLPYGSIVTITYLPPSYTGGAQVGDTGDVFEAYGDGSHRIHNIPILIGVKCMLSKDYYSNSYISNKTIKERNLVAMTGTMSLTIDSPNVVGTGTLFTSELSVGDTIKFDVDGGYGWDRVIASITDDTNLVMDTTVDAVDDLTTDQIFNRVDFGKILMQPGGLINTDVHDGTAYSGLTGSENLAPPIEQLVLIALDNNKFSVNAESVTFNGDVVVYDFDDTEIYDRQENLITTRNGLIISRSNKKLNISVNKDWRAQRFRRFRLNDEQWERFKCTQNLYKLESGSQTYYVGGISSLSRQEAKRYILDTLEYGLTYQDFTIENTEDNVFTSGYTGAYADVPSDVNKTIFDAYSPLNAQSGGFSYFGYYHGINFNEIKCKDLLIIPLTENHEVKPIVEEFNVENLENSVFLDYNKGQGISEIIKVDCVDIRQSTLLTGGQLVSKNGYIERFVSYESFWVENFGHLRNVINFSSLTLKNYGIVKSSQFAGAWSYPVNFVGESRFIITADSIVLCSVFGIGTSNATYNIITQSVCKDIFFKYFSLGNSTFKINGSFLSIANHEDNNYANNTWFQISATAGCTFELNPGWYKNVGLEYWFSGAIRDKHIKTDFASKKLYYTRLLNNELEVVPVTVPTTLWVEILLSGSVNVVSPVKGNNVIFTISIKNIGYLYVSGINITALLPDGYTYVSDDAAGNYDNTTGIWNIEMLPFPGSNTIAITATVEATGTYNLGVTATFNETPITAGNLSKTINVTPIA